MFKRGWRFDIPVLGKTIKVNYKGKEVSAEFIVVQLNDNLRSLPLISVSLSRQLGRIDELLVNSVNLLDGFDDLFNGIGCLNTGFMYKISLNDSIKTKNIHARRLPPQLIDAVHHELERIIRPITEPTEGSSPLFSKWKKSGAICLVVDFRHLNRAVKRQNFRILRFDDLITSLRGN